MLFVFYWWALAVLPEMMPDADPRKSPFLQVFAGLDRKPELEQRKQGRDLLRAYLLEWNEKLPLRGW